MKLFCEVRAIIPYSPKTVVHQYLHYSERTEIMTRYRMLFLSPVQLLALITLYMLYHMSNSRYSTPLACMCGVFLQTLERFWKHVNFYLWDSVGIDLSHTSFLHHINRSMARLSITPLPPPSTHHSSCLLTHSPIHSPIYSYIIVVCCDVVLILLYFHIYCYCK